VLFCQPTELQNYVVCVLTVVCIVVPFVVERVTSEPQPLLWFTDQREYRIARPLKATKEARPKYLKIEDMSFELTFGGYFKCWGGCLENIEHTEEYF
jgi:hypothetical protein